MAGAGSARSRIRPSRQTGLARTPAGSGGPEPAKEGEIVSNGRGSNIGSEAGEPAPAAARQPAGTLEAGDARFDPGAEVSQLPVDPAALDHV